jgi:subtilisin family serine protease
VNVVSAQSFFIDDDTYYSLAGWDIAALDTEYETWGGLSGYFHIMAQTGTSMSAPAVTGTIALWMQADPTLTTDRILDVIAHTSRQPEATLSYPNSEYGHGEIDAYAGLLYLLDPSGVLPVSRHQPRQAAITLDGRTLRVTLPAASLPAATLRIYTTAGRLVAQHNINDSEAAISLATLPAGIYAVQLTTPDASTTGSTLIRL